MTSRRRKRQCHPCGILDVWELKRALSDLKVKEKHTESIWRQVVQRNLSLDVVADDEKLPRALRQILATYFQTCSSRVLRFQPNDESDSGGKLEVELFDGQRVETVVIVHQDDRPSQGPRRRSTVCVSSQVGCKMGCRFCATGTMGLQAQLSAGEIAEQVWHAREYCPEDAPVRNVVFMGMGEPLDNYDNVLGALQVLSSQSAFALALRNVTVSTVGVPGMIQRLAEDRPEVNLAVSLHAPSQELRKRIVPSAGAFQLEDLMREIDEYAELTERKVMLEYILIDGVNAAKGIAHELGRLCTGRRVSVNLIPYNTTEIGESQGYRTPSEATCKTFQDTVLKYLDFEGKKVYTTLRRSSAKGRSVDGACGQLVLKKLPKATAGESMGGVPDIEDIGGPRSDGKSAATGARVPGVARKADGNKLSRSDKHSVVGHLRYMSVFVFVAGSAILAKLLWDWHSR